LVYLYSTIKMMHGPVNLSSVMYLVSMKLDVNFRLHGSSLRFLIKDHLCWPGNIA